MKRAFVSSITPFNENPSDFSRAKYTTENKSRVDKYFKSIEPCAACGLIYDCIEGMELQKENVGYCDGEFIWTSQDVYHFEKYNAAITDEFMAHITKMAS